MGKKNNIGDFPGGLVVKTPSFQCRGHGFDPWCHVVQPEKKKKNDLITVELYLA